MKSTLAILLLTICSFAQLIAQDGTIPSDQKKTLIGINVTTTLAGFFNAGGQNVPKDPYLFSLKLFRDKKTWRFGANFKVDLSKEDFQIGNIREVKESEFLMRVGWEWQQTISKRFALYYGVDAVGSFFQEKSSFEFFSDLDSKTNTFGLGAGPFLGAYFKINERIWLSTETYAYGIFYAGESTTEIGQGIPDEISEIRKFSLLPAIPNSLFIHFSF